jgi:hypothetical protein
VSEQDEQVSGQERNPVAELSARLADLRQDEPEREPETGEPTGGPEANAEATPEGAPAEGYDANRNVFVKQFNLGLPDLHLLGADELAEHSQTAALTDVTARAAREQGYAPTGPARFVYGAPDDGKSALSFAVPVEPRVSAPAVPEQAPSRSGD